MTEPVDIVTLDTTSLGDRSYLVSDGSVAIVVDPQRDIDRILDAAAARGVEITHVAETHIHNDYVSGGLDLARRTGADYLVAAADDVDFDRHPLDDGDQITTGRLALRAVHTPGHTPNHLSFELRVDGDTRAVFTGGSLLFGAAGRTDLIAASRTEELTRAQFRSIHRLATELPESAQVFPTHGFGSFCSATETADRDSSTIAVERRDNPVFALEEDDFVDQLLAGLNAYPSYYAHMGAVNSAGPAPFELTDPRPVSPADLALRIERGDWVVDLRTRRAFARRHLAGTVSFELGDPFATYLGWVIPWGSPITLLAETSEQLDDARRDLTRIGIDAPDSAAGPLDDLVEQPRWDGYRTATFDDLFAARRTGDVKILDVRRDDEWSEGHLQGALHIPFYELTERVAELTADQELWVHCASGFRASIAASILARSDRSPVLVDDDWDPSYAEAVPEDGG